MNKNSQEDNKLLETLESRFNQNMSRHREIEWSSVSKALESQPDKLRTLNEMEQTGGEPDVVFFEDKTEEITFVDCSPESPKGRTNLCYDKAALDSRKKFKPANSAQQMAEEMGIELLSEEEYRTLQTLGEFDLKTSSWLQTPSNIRELGGAIFGDRRFDTVFVYHNGAESYYRGRGFRGKVRV